MAGYSTNRSRADLKFMAEDIGPELMPFLKTEDMVKGMNRKKRREFISLMNLKEVLSDIPVGQRLSGISTQERLSGISPTEILSNMSIEELVKNIPSEQQKMLFELFLKTLAAGSRS